MGMAVRRSSGWAFAAVVFGCALIAETVKHPTRVLIGPKTRGWAYSNFNYTEWAANQTFFVGDWLYFLYDRNQANVLEVNKTGYENCNSSDLIANWTRGAGRDVVELNTTGTRYFICGNYMCQAGSKLEVHAVYLPPPPASSPDQTRGGAAPASIACALRYVVPAAVAVAAVWDSLLRLCW